MAKLSQIAKVVIALSTSTIAKASFGIPLIVAPTSGFAERVRIYSDYDAAVDDELEAPLLKAINQTFAQTPRPDRVYVGRRDVEALTVTIDGDVMVGRNYSLSVSGTDISYTAKQDDTAGNIYTELAAALGTVSVGSDNFVMASDASGLTMTAIDPAKAIVVKPVNNVVINADGDANNIASDLTAINRENKAWYGFMLTERSDALLMQAALWAESQTKLFFACSGSAAIWDPASTDDIASQLQRGQYFRTALIAHKNAATEYPEAAWMGRCFTIAPGGETWALKVLSTIQPSNFSDTEQTVIWGKNANTYEQYSDNVFLTNPGKVSAGEWIDIIRGRDYAEDMIQKDVASAMIRAKKIPYTNSGIQILANTVRGSLIKLQQAGVIAPDEVNGDGETVPGFRLFYPNAADVDADTKASRVLYMSFNALLAGAIQVTDINGTLSYTYEGAA